MKKVILMGSLCLALGMASCKTYCPAYNYSKVESPTQKVKTAVAPVQEAVDVANS